MGDCDEKENKRSWRERPAPMGQCTPVLYGIFDFMVRIHVVDQQTGDSTDGGALE